MTKTTAHTPYWVWFFTPDVLYEEHDHTDGVCDLPDHATYAQLLAETGWPRQLTCHYMVDIDRIPPLCSCSLCQGRWKPAARRRARHTAQRVCRAVETDPSGGWDDQLPSFEPFSRPLASND